MSRGAPAEGGEAQHPVRGALVADARDLHQDVVDPEELDLAADEVEAPQRPSPLSPEHDAEIVGPARMLLFDNRDSRGRSAVEEYTLPKMRRAWQYDGTDGDPFYSHTCGTSQRLANGNTLITESDNGRALEVTPDGTKVWEFYTPERAGDHDEYIATLFEVQRIDDTDVEPWLQRKTTH